MIDIADRNYKPDMNEIGEYIENPLFFRLCEDMNGKFAAKHSIEYSRDSVLLGWNVKFFKAGRTLCRIYPRRSFFSVLVVVGRKEKDRVEALLPEMSEEMNRLYNGTKEGMGQRWLVTDLTEANAMYEDIMKIAEIRRESR